MCSARTYSIAPRRLASTDRNALVDQLELALYAGKLSAYAQGFAVMEAASREFSWSLPMATIARIWRAGCIIRSQFLGAIASAFPESGRLSNLLVAPEFVARMKESVPSLRKTIDKPGVYGFKCKPHYGMGMVGLIVVGEPVNKTAAAAVEQKGKAKKKFEDLLGQIGG